MSSVREYAASLLSSSEMVKKAGVVSTPEGAVRRSIEFATVLIDHVSGESEFVQEFAKEHFKNNFGMRFSYGDFASAEGLASKAIEMGRLLDSQLTPVEAVSVEADPVVEPVKVDPVVEAEPTVTKLSEKEIGESLLSAVGAPSRAVNALAKVGIKTVSDFELFAQTRTHEDVDGVGAASWDDTVAAIAAFRESQSV